MAVQQKVKPRKKKHDCPPHHWIINSDNIGHCIKEGCSEVRDFGKLLGHKSKLSGLTVKNKAEASAKRSDVAKKRWQDPEYRARQRVAMKGKRGRPQKYE